VDIWINLFKNKLPLEYVPARKEANLIEILHQGDETILLFERLFTLTPTPSPCLVRFLGLEKTAQTKNVQTKSIIHIQLSLVYAQMKDFLCQIRGNLHEPNF